MWFLYFVTYFDAEYRESCFFCKWILEKKNITYFYEILLFYIFYLQNTIFSIYYIHMKTTWAASNDFFSTLRPVIDNYHPDGFVVPVPIDLNASQVRINNLLDKKYVLVDYSEAGAIPMLKPWQIRINSLMATVQNNLWPIWYDLSIKIDALKKHIESKITNTQEQEQEIKRHYSNANLIDDVGSAKIQVIHETRDIAISKFVKELLSYIDDQPTYLKNSMDVIIMDIQWLIPKI
jgi:hypothetical protein